jgi:hypothetical protein
VRRETVCVPDVEVGMLWLLGNVLNWTNINPIQDKQPSVDDERKEPS